MITQPQTNHRVNLLVKGKSDQPIKKTMNNVHTYITILLRTLFLVGFMVSFTCINLSGQSAQSLWSQGDMLYDAGDYEDALESYNQSLAVEEQFETAFNLGNSAYQLDKVEEAQKAYELALSLASTDEYKSLTHYNLGNLYFKNDTIAKETVIKAIENYKMAIRLDQNNERAHGNLFIAQKALNHIQQQEQQQKQQEQEQNQENQDQQNQDQQNSDEQQEQEEQYEPEDSEENQDQNQEQQNSEDENQDENQEEQYQKSQMEINREEIANILRMVAEEDQRVQGKLIKKQSDNTKKTKKKW